MTAVLATSAVSKRVRAFWRERRLNAQNNNSFPSQHAGECFAAAAILEGSRQDASGPVAIGVATAVSIARLISGKHHLADVVAGGASGILAATMIWKRGARAR